MQNYLKINIKKLLKADIIFEKEKKVPLQMAKLTWGDHTILWRNKLRGKLFCCKTGTGPQVFSIKGFLKGTKKVNLKDYQYFKTGTGTVK